MWYWMEASEIHLTRRDQEVTVDEVNQAVRQIGGEVGTEVSGPVLPQAAGDEDFGVFILRELDVGIALVVTKKDVEAGLILLDEVVLKRQGLLFVFDENVIDVMGVGDERTGLGIGEMVDREVAADAVAETLGLADVDDP
jgi:hypothetical protein